MFKHVLCVFVITFAVNVSSQFINLELPNFLNNITVTDISNILRVLPIPNPLTFDGLPLSRTDVTYFVYTRDNPDIPVLLRSYSANLSPIDPRNEVKFIIHGWMESANRTYMRAVENAYIQRGNYNIIGVDWQRPALNEYSIAARNTKTVGRELANFIIKLNREAGIPLSQIHIVGHSLGAHVAGFAGKDIIRRTGRKVSRITALDAAGPLYESPIPVDENNRLDKDDAEFVDCIHTDGGIFGMVQPIGHVDFYPNGGLPRQPGCVRINIRELSSRVIIDDMFCSHSRSHELFTESINSDQLIGTQCESYANFQMGLCAGRPVSQMGEGMDRQTRGTYYLDTNAQRPFARP